MLNWIPTIPEILDKIGCTFAGHEWKYYVHRGDDNLNGRRYRVCQICEKSEWVR